VAFITLQFCIWVGPTIERACVFNVLISNKFTYYKANEEKKGSTLPVGDSAFVDVVGAHVELNLVAGHNTDAIEVAILPAR